MFDLLSFFHADLGHFGYITRMLWPQGERLAFPTETEDDGETSRAQPIVAA